MIMVPFARPTVHNRLLAALGAEEFALIRGHLEPVGFKRGDVIVAINQPIQHVYFVEQGIVSVVADSESRRIEVGIIGQEGFAGSPLLLGVDRTPHESFVQAEGEALRLRAAEFLHACEVSRPLDLLLRRYLHVFQIQTAQTALSNGAYTIEERLARWLLMCSDRMNDAELSITHEFLSMMLGVRRSGVTVALHMLESAHMIATRRGRIRILDRGKMLEAAGDSYGLPEAEYDGLIAGPAAARAAQDGRA